MRQSADVGASVVLAGVGTLIVYAARGLIKGDDPLGPSFLPTVIGAALIGLAFILGARALLVQRPDAGLAESYDLASVARVVAASIAMLGFVLGLAYAPAIGFPIFSTVMVLVLTILFGGRLSLGTVAFSAILSIAVYVLFRIWFKLPLPGPTWS